MKKYIILALLSITYMASFGGVIELEGVFQGKNVYVMNPFSQSGVGFCVYEVTVNGKVTTDEINSSAFEIDFSTFQLSLGTEIKVTIKHKENCRPKVLNPEVLKPKSTFEVKLINVSKDGVLNWTTEGEAGKLPFVVEQFRWNKWVKAGTVVGKGVPNSNKYSMKVNLHSGSNKFRVKQIDYTNKPRYSSDVPFRSMTPPVSLSSRRVNDELKFSMETMYEIYDYYGNLVKKGVGATVEVSSLENGKYFLNFDNTMEEITKK